jgi:RNA polymerase sigma-54 factor
MQKLHLKQKLIHKLTPQQLQLVRLLQIPAIDIHQRIEQEIADNPVLEVASEQGTDSLDEQADNLLEDNLPMYLDEEVPYYYARTTFRDPDAAARWASREAAVPTRYSLQEYLLEQLEMLELDERQYKIGQYLIGSLEADGYIRRDLSALVNDLLLLQYIKTNEKEVESILKQIQNFDPPGIGARTLQECLLIQLHRQQPRPVREMAIQITSRAFEAFTKKHYTAIIKILGVEDQELFKGALELIAKLNPKPGGSLVSDAQQNQVLYPDFLVTKQGGQLEIHLNTYHAPELKISRSYLDILEESQRAAKESPKKKELQEATAFVKQKVGAAKWFIDALKQRQQTLLRTMQAIVELQYDFFLEGDESKLKPMILKDVAQVIDMDISTVSRIVNNKSVQTNFGIYPLKFFFTEAISTTIGEDVSSQAVRQALAALIEKENKQQPYADEQLAAMLLQQGYQIARRTVAKYREQLRIPVARLRKEL